MGRDPATGRQVADQRARQDSTRRAREDIREYRRISEELFPLICPFGHF
jgi:hypothetical protein